MATKTATETTAPTLRVITAEELETFLDRDDLGSKLVPVPEWAPGVAFRIRGLSLDDIWETRALVADIPAGPERKNAIDLEFVRRGVIEPVLKNHHIEKLRTKSADAVLRLIDEISTLNGASGGGEALAGEFPAERGA